MRLTYIQECVWYFCWTTIRVWVTAMAANILHAVFKERHWVIFAGPTVLTTADTHTCWILFRNIYGTATLGPFPRNVTQDPPSLSESNIIWREELLLWAFGELATAWKIRPCGLWTKDLLVHGDPGYHERQRWAVAEQSAQPHRSWEQYVRNDSYRVQNTQLETTTKVSIPWLTSSNKSTR